MTKIEVSGHNGNDLIDNNTNVTMQANGGAGVDTLYGGGGHDTVYGEHVHGVAGSDLLIAETSGASLNGGAGTNVLADGTTSDPVTVGSDGAQYVVASDGTSWRQVTTVAGWFNIRTFDKAATGQVYWVSKDYVSYRDDEHMWANTADLVADNYGRLYWQGTNGTSYRRTTVVDIPASPPRCHFLLSQNPRSAVVGSFLRSPLEGHSSICS
ncbi:MAG: hypothetical protein ACFCD0_29055 [Gemmataceae bacterium]